MAGFGFHSTYAERFALQPAAWVADSLHATARPRPAQAQIKLSCHSITPRAFHRSQRGRVEWAKSPDRKGQSMLHVEHHSRKIGPPRWLGRGRLQSVTLHIPYGRVQTKEYPYVSTTRWTSEANKTEGAIQSGRTPCAWDLTGFVLPFSPYSDTMLFRLLNRVFGGHAGPAKEQPRGAESSPRSTQLNDVGDNDNAGKRECVSVTTDHAAWNEPTTKCQQYQVRYESLDRQRHEPNVPHQAELEGKARIQAEQDRNKTIVAQVSMEKDAIAMERQERNVLYQAELQDKAKIQRECDRYKATLDQVSMEKDAIAKERQQLRVMLEAERKEKDKITADCTKYREVAAGRIIEDGGPPNIQGRYRTMGEVLGGIKQAVTVTASEWAEDMSTNLGSQASAIPRILARVFVECHALVEHRRLEVYSFFLCGSMTANAATEMEENTAVFMRRHMRLHFDTMFPLRGQPQEDAYGAILDKFATWVSTALEGRITEEQVAGLLQSHQLRRLVTTYLDIMVNVTLQHPRLEFSDDCGQEQAFDVEVHANPIDGSILKRGETCVVVFPALPSQKKYVLPALGD